MASTPTTLSFAERSDGQEVNSNSQLHAVIVFLITTLGGYLQFQYQSRNASLFGENTNIMSAIFINLILYALGLIAEFKLKIQSSRFLSIIKRFSPLFGILVVVLLLIILFPLLGLVAFILWSLFTVEAVIKSVQEIRQWLPHVFLHVRQTITSHYGNPATGNEESGFPGEEGNELPV